METETPRKLNHYQRHIRRMKGCLYCEWCGKRTEVGANEGYRWSEIPTFSPPGKKRNVESWESYYEDNKAGFLCDRPLCVGGRPETL